MEYNDERLTPEIFEQMCKEYHKSFKSNIYFNEQPIDKDKLKKSVENLFMSEQKIYNLINSLKRFNLTPARQKQLQHLLNNFNIQQEQNKSLYDKNFEDIKIKIDYCNTLTEIIKESGKSIQEQLTICENDDLFKAKQQEMIENLIKRINITALMFGVCKYRK